MQTTTVLVFSYDFLLGDPSAHQNSNDTKDAAATKRRRIALGQASWCQAFWLPIQQRKHMDYKLAIDGTRLTISTVKQNEDDEEPSKRTPSTTTTADAVLNNNNNIDWNKLLQIALKKIHVQDLGDLSAKELLATIPLQNDTEGRGQADLQVMEKQLTVKVVWLVLDEDNEDNGHVLLVGSKTKLDKKCLVIRNMLAHYYWRLKGKQINL